LLLFLGGDAWRMLASGGRDTQVLDFFYLVNCRVFSVKCKPLSSNTRFLERVLYKGLSVKLCTYHFNERKKVDINYWVGEFIVRYNCFYYMSSAVS
jgi:hypothetical protein